MARPLARAPVALQAGALPGRAAAAPALPTDRSVALAPPSRRLQARFAVVRVNALAQKAEYVWYDGQEGQPIKVRRRCKDSWAVWQPQAMQGGWARRACRAPAPAVQRGRGRLLSRGERGLPSQPVAQLLLLASPARRRSAAVAGVPYRTPPLVWSPLQPTRLP